MPFCSCGQATASISNISTYIKGRLASEIRLLWILTQEVLLEILLSLSLKNLGFLKVSIWCKYSSIPLIWWAIIQVTCWYHLIIVMALGFLLDLQLIIGLQWFCTQNGRPTESILCQVWLLLASWFFRICNTGVIDRVHKLIFSSAKYLDRFFSFAFNIWLCNLLNNWSPWLA